MPRTIVDIEADILTINAALEELISGGRVTRLQTGSGEFVRTYDMQELTYENMLSEKNRLEDELAMLQPVEPVYRTGSTLPLQVRKFNI